MLAALVVTGAAAARQETPTDGTLTVKNGVGRIVFTGRGAGIGRFDKGQVTIKDPNPNDGTGPIVAGAEAEVSINDKTTRYQGSDVRFRIIGGKSTVTVVGTNITLNVIGTGLVTLDGRGSLDDGTFSFNGSTPQDISDDIITFLLSAPQAVGG